MAKVDLGTKITCPECEVKFYDLNNNPATCPKCANSFDPSTVAATIPAEILEPEIDDTEDEDGKKAKE